MALVNFSNVSSLSTDQQRYYNFLIRSWKTCTLGGVEFHVNPDSYKEHNERVQQGVSTLEGFGRFSYTVKPPTYTLAGFTGTAGYAQIRQMNSFVPKPGVKDSPLIWTYPNMFEGSKTVYVDTFDRNTDQDTFLYYSYQIVLEEFPPGYTSRGYTQIYSPIGTTQSGYFPIP